MESKVLSSYFNLTFEGSIELTMKINPSIFDPGRHSTVSFKENVILSSPKNLENVASEIARGHPISKGWNSSEKVLLSVTTSPLVKLFEITKVDLKILAMRESLCQTQ